jgi:putative endonuclease
MAYIVYIITNKAKGTFYIGITSNLRRRITEHKLGLIEGFSKKYNLTKLIYFEQFQYVEDAIQREKKLKRWKKEWKCDLIENLNPEWNDLYEKIFGPKDLEYNYDILNIHLKNRTKIPDQVRDDTF